MSKQQKPVWRMNSGLGLPSDVKRFGEVVFKYGEHYEMDSEPDEYYWPIDECASDIAAYETTRTKAAKYERVECDKCDGVESWTSTIGGKPCANCNGKGYKLEAIK